MSKKEIDALKDEVRSIRAIAWVLIFTVIILSVCAFINFGMIRENIRSILKMNEELWDEQIELDKDHSKFIKDQSEINQMLMERLRAPKCRKKK